MLIDWFTVAAQIVNFLVLMALLKIFLYDRVIRAMAEREQKIVSRLDEAERKSQEAEERREKIEAEENKLQEKREEILSEAREAARSKREELERKARSEVDALRDRWTEAIGEQQENLAKDVQKTAARQVLAAARRVVAEMADEDFQHRLVATFASRIREMDAEDKRTLTEGLDEKHASGEVISDEKLSTTDRRRITRLLREELHPKIEIDYRTDGALLGGIELRVSGKKISWSPRQYFAELEENVLQALAEASRNNDRASAGKESGKDPEPSG